MSMVSPDYPGLPPWDVNPENRLRRGFAAQGMRLPLNPDGPRVRPIGVSNGKCTTLIRIKTEQDGLIHAYPWPPGE